MNDRALDPSPALEQIALHATMGALLLWSGVLAREWPRLAAGGAICGEPEGCSDIASFAGPPPP